MADEPGPPGAVRSRAGLVPAQPSARTSTSPRAWTTRSTACASCWRRSRASTRRRVWSCSRGRHPGGDNGQACVGAGQFRTPSGCDNRGQERPAEALPDGGGGSHGHSLAHDPSRVRGRRAGRGLGTVLACRPGTAGAQATELVHWSWLAASDAEVWAKMIQDFNDAHKGKGVQIKMEVVPEEQYDHQGPGRGRDRQRARLRLGHRGAACQMGQGRRDRPARRSREAGGPRPRGFRRVLDQAGPLSEIRQRPVHDPLDLMSLQPEVNLDHVKEAGLDPDKFPTDGNDLIEWAKAMTKRDGDKVTRSGIMMTGSGVQPTVTWGIVAAQMGFQRASATTSRPPASIPRPASQAMQWVLDLFDKWKVSHPRRDRPLQGVRHRPGLDLLDRPLDAQRLRPAEAQLPHLPVPDHRRASASPISRWAAWSSTSSRTRAATRRRCRP